MFLKLVLIPSSGVVREKVPTALDLLERSLNSVHEVFLLMIASSA